MGRCPDRDGSKCATPAMVALPTTEEKASMEKATIIEIDLAKRVFQLQTV